ncbi:MAG: hypothetical protein R2698_02490 [Microthrixaceae bacterium]
MGFWEDNSAVMRVLDLASLEGDERFAAMRRRLLAEFNATLADAIRTAQEAGRVGDALDAAAAAAVLVSMLTHVSSHRTTFEDYGITSEDLRRVLASILFTTVSGSKVPS